jgi:hypothetical protein
MQVKGNPWNMAVVIAVAILLEGCSSLPPVLQRWAGLEIATTNLQRDDFKANESFYFSEDGLVQVHPTVSNAPAVAWRVRGVWLEIDTTNDGTFQTRMRAIAVKDGRIVAQSPTGKKSVWRPDRVRVVIEMVRPSPPGVYLP